MLLHDYLEYFAKESPNHPLIEMDDIALTYSEGNQRANQMAYAFLDMGLTKGDKFAWLSKNCIDMVLMFCAASKVGVVPVPLNYRLAPPEWQYIINDAHCKALICEDEYTTGIEGIRSNLKKVNHFITIDCSSHAGWKNIDALLSAHPTSNLQQSINPEDQLYQMYTSGTTGHPKGVIISQRALDEFTKMSSLQLRPKVLESRSLLITPLYHAAGGTNAMGSISHGMSIVLHREFDPAKVVKDLAEKQITHAGMVPAMIQACVYGIDGIEQQQFPALENMIYGSSPIAESTIRKALEIFDCDFVQGFGMTELTSIATFLSPGAHLRALNGEPHLLLSCGRATAGTEIRIVNKAGTELPKGEIGEIKVKGPQLMDGYANLPEATAETLKDGWLYTGDAAYMDDEGFVYIQDRLKDMIVSGGENIYSKEVENALFEHPQIIDAAVIGIPSEQWGEAILAFLVTKDGQPLDEQQLIDFCRKLLAGYKVPRQFKFVDQLPRNPSGKVLKKDLRKPYWEETTRHVG